MDIRKLDEQVGVSGQILPSDIAEIKAAGYEVIVMNRPDQEEMGQPSRASLQKEAEAQGLAFVYLPVTPGQPIDAQIQSFAHLLEGEGRPVFAFCRSGTRSAMLWARASAPKLGREFVVEATQNAGYDVSQFV